MVSGGPSDDPSRGLVSRLIFILLLPLRLIDWLGRGLLWLVARGWKLIISPWMPPACRFEPTCSEYAAEAVRVHHFPKAFLLILWRVWRCNPTYDGGYDPVPQTGEWPERRPFSQKTAHTEEDVELKQEADQDRL